MLGGMSVYAQHNSSLRQSRSSSSIVSAYTDSLAALKARSFASSNYSPDSTPVSPYFYRLVGPTTYYTKAVHDELSLSGPYDPLAPTTPGIQWRDSLNSSIDHHLIGIYTSRPSMVQYHDAQYRDLEVIQTSKKAYEKELKTAIGDVPPVVDVTSLAGDVDVDLTIAKPNFWKRTGAFSLQFTQNYFSENWYKGGNNNGTMLATLALQAVYDDQRKITWENKLDMRLGFVTTTSDSCHTFLTNNDRLDLYSKFGVKAAKKTWYYTATAEALTQFMPGYKTNDRRIYSDFIAPLDVSFSLGMDFKPTLKNGNTLSVTLLPGSYKMRYIGNRDENIHRVYNMLGKDMTHDVGSKVELNSKLTLCKNFTWKCRFYYFTSYKYAESELENVLSLAFSKYISSELYTLWRFDDNRDRKYFDDNLGYFQFKEFLTLGLKYAF